MKQLFDHRVYVSVNGGHLWDTSFWQRIRYEKMPSQTERTFTDFDEFFKFVNEGNLRNGETDYTLFCNRPVACVSVASFDRSAYRLTAKNFKSVRVVSVCEPLERVPTYKFLADTLPAEQFVEWLNDTKAKMGE